tara:strand:- start:10819 stop:11403 length:585 start_codon:yes stop_codon:yes gene_type:complete
MITNKTIIIDIDNTILCPMDKWIAWSAENSNSCDERRYLKDCVTGNVDYNFSNYFDLHEGVDGLDFFRQEDLYDDIELLPNAKHVITSLSEENTILFVSFSKSWHLKSKFSIIKRNFPWVIEGERGAFISCKHKHHVPSDIFIDDRALLCNKHPAKLKICMNTPFTQEEKLDENNVTRVDNWSEIGKLLGVEGY